MANDAVQANDMQDGPEDETARLARTADALAEIGTDLYMSADGSITARDASEIAYLGTVGEAGTWEWEEDHPEPAAVVEAASAESSTPAADVAQEIVPAAAPAPAGERARVLPEWATDGRVVLPWIGGRAAAGASLGTFHLVRSPWYALRGLTGLVRGACRWVARPDDDEQHRADLARAGSLRARGELRFARNRGRAVRLGAALVPPGLVAAWFEWGQWGVVPAVTCSAAFVALAIAGWRAERAARTPREAAAMRRRVPALSRPFVSEALAIVGCGPVTLPSGSTAAPVIISSSPARGGEVMVIELPPGVPVSRLVKKHEEFAQALGRPAECVVIEPQPRVSPGRFELFVAAKRLDEKGAPAWPWAGGKRRSFFDGVPMGVDTRGRGVVVPLFESNGLIAGATGMGKSFTARLLLMGAALDPTVTILVHNLKGGPDYRAFAPIAHTLRAGGSPADLEALTADLRWMQSEIARRGRVLENLPAAEVPEGKLTPAIAAREGMGPVFLLVDEAQRAFASRAGREIATLFEDVVRTCRAVGMVVYVVTQGTKEGAIPSGILDQLPHRIGHGVTTISDANLILGSDAHGRTYRAVDIDTPGIAYVGTAGGSMVKAAMAKVDLPGVEKLVQAAHALRVDAGTLSGMAAGSTPADDHDGGHGAFLADVLAAWPAEGDGPRRNASSEELAALLVECDAGEYGELDGPGVSRRMADAGVKVSAQRMPGGGSARGVKRADVVQAAAEHGAP
jgi:S-DNA-T family DNA segregation ATPase FtsK/SpoIIIE